MRTHTESIHNMTLAPIQQILPQFSQGRPFESWESLSAVSALGMPEPEDQLLSRVWQLARCYLQELENSRSIQQKLLAKQPPILKGMEVAWRYLPIMGVSGDYYDFLSLQEGRYSVAVGDACGKGMGAALLVASVCATIRAQAQSSLTGVGELLADLNEVVYRSTPTHQFVTLTYGIWDANAHTFTYSSAGHPPVLHYQAQTGCVRELSAGGVVLGVFEGMAYPTETVSLGAEDALVIYTDGITEACNGSEEQFGIRRLRDVVAAHGRESSEELVESILTAASQFAHHGWEDDVTVVVMKRTPMYMSM